MNISVKQVWRLCRLGNSFARVRDVGSGKPGLQEERGVQEKRTLSLAPRGRSGGCKWPGEVGPEEPHPPAAGKGDYDLNLLCTPVPAPLQTMLDQEAGAWRAPQQVPGVRRPAWAGRAAVGSPGGVALAQAALGAPALVEHRWQVGCVHLSELLIVTQSGCEVPVFAWR